MVTNEQLYIAVGIPLLFNATLIGLLLAHMNSKFEAMNSKFGTRDTKFDAVNKRLDDLRDLWRAELRRVEEVLDARLNTSKSEPNPPPA